MMGKDPNRDDQSGGAVLFFVAVAIAVGLLFLVLGDCSAVAR